MKIDNQKIRSRIGNVLPFIVILFVEILLLKDGVRWWYSDDPTILKIAISYNFHDMFFSPSSYREMTASNFTPMAFALFRLDYLLFGLSPLCFYLHHYLMIYLALILFFKVCRIKFSLVAACVAVLIFMMTLPFIQSIELLMQRHYIEGLFFALSAFYFFHRYLKSDKKLWLFLAAITYLAAALSKEIFVPLPMLLIFFPEKSFKQRIWGLIPLFFSLGLYCIWRTIMLTSIGGYGLALGVKQMFDVPVDLLYLIGGTQPGFVVVVSLMAAVFFMLARPREKFFAIIFIFVVVVPILPVIALQEIRYALLPALGVGILSGWCVDGFCKDFESGSLNKIIGIFKACSMGVLVVCTGIMLMNNMMAWLPAFRVSHHKAMIEGDYLLNHGDNKDFIKGPVYLPVFFSGLGWLRTEILGIKPGPRPLFDNFQLLHEKNYNVFEYHRDVKKLVPINNYAKQMEQFARILDMKKSLSLEVSYDEPLVEWKFGPWDDGEYTMIFEAYYPLLMPLSKTGRHPLKFKENVFLRLRYRSTKGWVTFSPVLEFKCKKGNAFLAWQRGKEI